MSRAGAPAVAITCRAVRWADLPAFSDQFTEGQKIGDNFAPARSPPQRTDYIALPFVMAQDG
jgi:hypothetical protein